MESIKFSGGTSESITATTNSLPVSERGYTYRTSTSTGTLKATPGVLGGWIGTTAGTFAIKDGATELGVFTVSAGVVVSLPPIRMATSITISASAGVATVFYR